MIEMGSHCCYHVAGSHWMRVVAVVLLWVAQCSYGDNTGVGSGYNVTSMSEEGGGSIVVATLEIINSTSLYGPDIPNLSVCVSYEDPDHIHVHITDNNKSSPQRWEVPFDLIPRATACPNDTSGQDPSAKKDSNSSHPLQFSYTTNPFGFAITRTSNNEVLFNSTPPAAGSSSPFGPMVFKGQYLEISTLLPPNASIYGLGESTRPAGFRLQSGHVYTLWATDTASVNTDVDLYGTYPFYLDMRDGGSGHGVLLLNSNGMDVSYGGEYMTYKVLGGVLDFYFFCGPSPLSVVQQLTRLVGLPAPMPYWSFGFQQSKYGYTNVEELEEVRKNYSLAKIPLEVMWSDIDHMDNKKDFTLDPINYPADKMQAFVEALHSDGQRYVIIIDPGIKTEKNYTTYEAGLIADVYIKDSLSNYYLGQVWPGPVNFPDFFNPNTQPYWASEISKFHETLAFDGLWIDMNEISNFCTGISCTLPTSATCPTVDNPTQCCLTCDDSNATNWDNPPFLINKLGAHAALGVSTIATSATHFDGILEYNAHNLYGFSEAKATNIALQSIMNERPFVLSRSTFIGSGKYTAHWTGDNGATWNDLAYSIVGILNAGLVGIPMAGADICGFLFNTTEELCNRWIQLGAFYPFSRDHSDIHSMPQELYRWESVATSARKALGLRYRLLPHLYTLAFEAHVMGSPIARPLFFEFPLDTTTLGISSQFLLGKSILVSPVLSSGVQSIEAYFPKGFWYNLFDYSHINASEGSYQVLPAPLDTINVHMHEGSIILLQEEAMTTREARKTPFTLLVAFPLESGKLNEWKPSYAIGELFLDNGGDMEMEIVSGKSTFVNYEAYITSKNGYIKSYVREGQFASQQGFFLHKVVILGPKHSLHNLMINNQEASLHIKCTYEVSSHTEIFGLGLSMGEAFNISWSTMSM